MVRNSARLARWLSVAMLMGLSAVCAAQQAGARRKVIIDQDAFGPAGSNLQAILMLLQAGDVDVLGITVPSGDGWRDEEVSHALRLLEVAGRTDVHVYPGAVYPLVNSPLRTKRWEQLYGTLFYKGAWTETWPAEGTVRRTPYHADPFLVPASPAGMPSARPAAESAVDFLVRSVREYPGQVTILAAGPLTDIALAARLDPEFATLAKELVFMGGSFSPVAADNAFANDRSMPRGGNSTCAGTPKPPRSYCTSHGRRSPRYRSIPRRTRCSSRNTSSSSGRPRPLRCLSGQFGQPYPMWDELAVAVWLDPSIVTRSSSLLVDVDTEFHRRLRRYTQLDTGLRARPRRASGARGAGRRRAALRGPGPGPAQPGATQALSGSGCIILATRGNAFRQQEQAMQSPNGSSRPDVLRVGVGGPVGSGKTALMERCASGCATRSTSRRSPTTSIRRRTPNFCCARRPAARAHPGRRDRRLPAYRDPRGRLDQPRGGRRACASGSPTLDLILIESGGDNLAATFCPELADLTIYVIDVAAGDKIPRKGGPGITRSDLLVINKIDLAPYVGASLEVMARDASGCARRGRS